jgi:RING finger protein 121
MADFLNETSNSDPKLPQIAPLEEIIKSEEESLHRKLTPHEIELLTERVNYLREHQGHESQHSEMLMIIIAALIISQILIGLWKRYHLKSFNISTLLGLWLIPMVYDFLI